MVQRLLKRGGAEEYEMHGAITVDSQVISRRYQSEFPPVKDRQGLKYPHGFEACYRILVQNANTVPSLVIDYQRHAERAGQSL